MMQKIRDRDMTVDYVVRCVVRKCSHDVLYYGVTALELVEAIVPGQLTVDDVLDVRGGFDHSRGRGKYPRPGVVEDDRPKKFFFSGNVKRR